MEPIDNIDDPIISDVADTKHKPVEQKWLWTLYTVLTVMSIITLILTVTTLIVLSTKFGEISYSSVVTEELPEVYVIPEDTITPVKAQLARGTCWIFATISFVESALRRLAISTGKIRPNEYIALSEQAYGKLMLQLCNGTYGPIPSDIAPFCEDGGMGQGKTDDGEIEWMYYFRKYNSKFFYPTQICNYTVRRGDTDWVCDPVDLKTPETKTPFEVSIHSVTSQYTPQNIKQMIFDTKAPVGWGHASLGRTYLYPCDENSPFITSEECISHTKPCSSGFCSTVSSLSFAYDGIFQLRGEVTNRGGHAMNIVGWNDEFLGGGFILKNSWTFNSGHSLGYFMRNHSLFNEDQICPTYISAKRWIPMRYDCFKSKQDPELCPQITRTFIEQELKGATVLKCAGSSSITETTKAKANDYGFADCSTDEGRAYNYALETSPDSDGSDYKPYVEYPDGENGYAVFHLLRWLPGSEENVERIKTKYSTWEFLERIFVPNNLSQYLNTEHCGYYFMTYDVFLEHNLRHPIGGHDTYVFSSFNVTFNAQFDAHELYSKSVFEYQLPVFTGSLDLN
ncbi:hypothetical protein EIN_186530 [Entamoeba invadens IP1]|uniref:hypothetical protein n=1 Tax=Entamoeba invadens IP1 TaxID=370355 RepID=UPI0002C3DAB0|nr:hypothetical protein EIN_186530 [Entamoeba invadens IP1]ELP94226.1 hypothetical protein EIN_186530 [Entamoeba invadens IP1]|eukprot:XP_004260997.1 hypothetical protein EIN_186530 [Entamoeba invadens IP1]